MPRMAKHAAVHILQRYSVQSSTSSLPPSLPLSLPPPSLLLPSPDPVLDFFFLLYPRVRFQEVHLLAGSQVPNARSSASKQTCILPAIVGPTVAHAACIAPKLSATRSLGSTRDNPQGDPPMQLTSSGGRLRAPAWMLVLCSVSSSRVVAYNL